MILFPAIDIRGGNCVRLSQGDFNKENVYFDNPSEVAKMWEDCGAQYIHVVDLDGALKGKGENRNAIKKMCESVNIPIQLGGGIRNLIDLDEVFSLGVTRAIIGSSAISDIDFVKKSLTKFGEKIVVSLDASGGKIAVKGWTEITDILAVEFAKTLEEYGLKTIVYTDISKDGMMQGPNYKELSIMQSSTNMNIIASGGISSIEHILRVKDMNLYGSIVGKALYTGDVDLKDALAQVNK